MPNLTTIILQFGKCNGSYKVHNKNPEIPAHPLTSLQVALLKDKNDTNLIPAGAAINLFSLCAFRYMPIFPIAEVRGH